MRSRFNRPVSPAISTTCRFGTPNVFATSAISAVLAAPSTGGAASRAVK